MSTSSTTPSEAYLGNLCDRAFLRLWSYPNLFRDQGKTGGGDGKELCDLLVVFGDDVLIFSDKHCRFRPARSLDIAWRRWYRDAVLQSAKQIAGAERWLNQFPDRVFLDRACSQPFPLTFPAAPRVHRIITCRGAAEASKATWAGTGSLFVTNETLESCVNRPFRLGCIDSAQRTYHVFDEVALDVVLDELDTVSDFCRYLTCKGRFFSRFPSVIAAGEDDLLGFYLSGRREDRSGHDFVVDRSQDLVLIDEGFWEGYRTGPQRAAKQEADRVSYAWDELIERFSYHMITGTQYATSGGLRETEVIVRWMAREPRLRRRLLANNLLDLMSSTGTDQIRKRLLVGGTGDPLWVFLVLHRPDRVDRDQYRQARLELLRRHCIAAKAKWPDALDIVGIATSPSSQTMSEDAVYVDARDWPKELRDEARRYHEEDGMFLTNVRRIDGTYNEYPLDE